MHPSENGVAHVSYRLGKQYKSFKATATFNDTGSGGNSVVRFSVVGDGKLLWLSKPISMGGTEDCAVDVAGVDLIELLVSPVGHARQAHAVWIEPRVEK